MSQFGLFPQRQLGLGDMFNISLPYHGEGRDPADPVLDLFGVGRNDLLLLTDTGESVLLVLLKQQKDGTIHQFVNIMF